MNWKNNFKNQLPVLLFCITAGLLATLWGYNYSAGNAEEQLPFIYRALDPAYLVKDFFTNTFSLFGPRTLYSEFIAFFVRAFPLAEVLFSLTFIANSALAYISSLTALFFFERSKFSAFLAAAAVLTIKTFWLGYSNILYRNFLEPAYLAMPFLLLGFYLILRKKYIGSALSFGVAALFNPLMGVETGWLLLGISFLIFIIKLFRKDIAFKKGIPLLIAGLILAVFSIGLFLPYSTQASIPDELFIKLVAYVRHPHHYVPSTFETWQYTQAALYLVAFTIFFWNALKYSEALRKQKLFLLLSGGAISLLCIGGYLFVEVWPSRIWTSAQMFRLPYLIKWFSLVLISGWIGNCIDNPEEGDSHLFGFSAGIGLITPLSMAVLALITWGRRVFLKRFKLSRQLPIEALTLIILILSMLIIKPELRTGALFLLLFGMVWIIYLLKWKYIGTLFSSIILLAVSGILILFNVSQSFPEFLKNEIPEFSLFANSNETAEMAQYAKVNTPADAVFLTPSNFGEFRIMAERAIVVDFTAFAFQDEAMLEWFDRVTDCYGAPSQLGFNNIAEFKKTYAEKTDAELLELAQKYDVDYIITFDYAKTNFPVIFRTTSYKLVKIPN